jgi:protein TonB
MLASTGGSALTSFARPKGGYQTRPRYPEAARRAGIEGVTTLRFEVRADGTVGAISVETSAGYAALDQAAMIAVRTWRFEPARRGSEAVPVWVTLPVRFELSSSR